MLFLVIIVDYPTSRLVYSRRFEIKKPNLSTSAGGPQFRRQEPAPLNCSSSIEPKAQVQEGRPLCYIAVNFFSEGSGRAKIIQFALVIKPDDLMSATVAGNLKKGETLPGSGEWRFIALLADGNGKGFPRWTRIF